MKLNKYLLSLILTLSFFIPCISQVKIGGYATKGGKKVQVTSTNSYTLQESYPNCTITIYNAGTLILSTIYSNSSGTPKSNPFTSDSNGYYFFYADNGVYDIKFSGTGITTPFTITDISISNGAVGTVGGDLSGTLPNPSVVTGVNANNILRLNSLSQIPNVDGSLIENIPRASSDNYLTTSIDDVRIPSQPLNYIIRDNFTSPNNTSNINRTSYPINNLPTNWGSGVGSWITKDNHLEPASTFADGDYQTRDIGVSNYTYTSYVVGFFQSSPGLVFRFVDANNFWLFQCEYGNNQAVVYEKLAGTFFIRATIPMAMTYGTTNVISITVSGNFIRAELAGTTPVFVESSNDVSSTIIGVRIGGAALSTPAQFDNLSIVPSFPYINNASIISTTPSTWKSREVAAPDVFYDFLHNRYVMDYSGFSDSLIWSTGIAYCYGNLKTCNWIDEPANPVKVPSVGDGYIAGSGKMWYDYRTKLYYYIYQTAPGQVSGGPLQNWRINLASSPDLITWTNLNSGNPIIPLGAPASFDVDGQHDPSLRLRDDGWYELIYAGRNGSILTAGHCFSRDLLHWTTSTQSTLGINSVGNLAFDGNNPKDYSLYFVRTFGGMRYIIRADTTDTGNSFTYIGGVFYKGAALTWQSAQVFDPDPFTIGNETYLFYGAGTILGDTENLNAGIGMSVINIPANNKSIFTSNWNSYTPTITTSTGTITTLGSVSGRYKLIDDRTVLFQASIPITTNGTGAGSIRITLPFTSTNVDFTCFGIDKNTNKSLSCLTQASGTYTSTTLYDGTYPGADGKTLIIQGSYEMIP